MIIQAIHVKLTSGHTGIQGENAFSSLDQQVSSPFNKKSGVKKGDRLQNSILKNGIT